MKKTWLMAAILMVFGLGLSTVAWSETPVGANLDLSEYRGKVVVLDFWASWCVPCRRSFPWLNSMNDKYAKDGLVIIGINVDTETKSAADFLQKYPARFKINYDSDGILATKYGVQGMPSSIVIGRDGQTSARHLGFKVRRQNEYEAAIVAALQQEMVE
ncbi:MAG: TlpA disulfide reductase family protein [Woeseiaceae bacterium]